MSRRSPSRVSLNKPCQAFLAASLVTLPRLTPTARMNWKSEPITGSAVQTRGRSPASPGQPISSRLPQQNTASPAHLPNKQMRRAVGRHYQRGEGPTHRGRQSADMAKLGGFSHHGLPISRPPSHPFLLSLELGGSETSVQKRLRGGRLHIYLRSLLSSRSTVYATLRPAIIVGEH